MQATSRQSNLPYRTLAIGTRHVGNFGSQATYSKQPILVANGNILCVTTQFACIEYIVMPNPCEHPRVLTCPADRALNSAIK